MDKRNVLISLAAVTIACLVLISVVDRSDEPERRQESVKGSVKASRTPAVINSVKVGGGPSARPASPENSLGYGGKRDSERARAFATADDLRQFVLNAKLHPEHASYFYALQALTECDDLISLLHSAEVVAGNELDPRRQTVIEISKRRCRNLQSGDVSASARRQLAAEGVQAGDVGLAVVRAPANGDSLAYDRNESIARTEKKISAIYAMADVGVVELAIRDLMSASDGLLINGRALSEIERSSLPAALLLLGCQLDAPCDKSNYFIRRECLALGRCDFANVEDFVQRADPQTWQMFTGGTRFSYQTAVQLKNEIATGVAKGDLATLVLRKSK